MTDQPETILDADQAAFAEIAGMPKHTKAHLFTMLEVEAIYERQAEPLELTGRLSQIVLANNFAAQDEETGTLRAGRLIWLGNMPFAQVRTIEETERAMDLFGQGLIDHPFGDDDYFIALNHGLGEQQFGVVLNVHPIATVPGEARFCLIAAGRFMRFFDQRAPLLEYANTVALRVGPQPGYFSAIGLEHKAAAEKIGLGDEIEHPMLSDLIAPMFGYALQMLSTEGIPIETVTPSAKEQKPRLRSGKQPLPSYYSVRAAEYVTLLSKSGRVDGAPAGGTHASPIPHIRRGHRRWLDAEHTRSVWVRDCLVNVRKDTPFTTTRAFYDASKGR